MRCHVDVGLDSRLQSPSRYWVLAKMMTKMMMVQKQDDASASVEEENEHCYVSASNSKEADADEEEQQSHGKQQHDETTDDYVGGEDAPPPTITKWEAIFMVINIYVGSPVVTLPAAFAYAGYSAAIIIALMAVFSGLCAYQLVDGMQRAGTSDIYVYAQKASGKVGKYMMVGVYTAAYMIYTIQVQMLMYACSNDILKMYGVNYYSTLGRAITVALPTLIVLILVGIDVFIPASAKYIGICGTALIVVIVILIFANLGITIHENHSMEYEVAHEFFRASTAFGSVVLSIGNFVEAGSLPCIYARMEKPKDFKFVLVVCFSFFALFYPLIGVVAYHALGNDIQNYVNVLDYLVMEISSDPSALLAVTTGIFYVKIALVQPILCEVVFGYFDNTLVERFQTKIKCIVNDDLRMKTTRMILRCTFFLFFTVTVSVILQYFSSEDALLALFSFAGAFFDIPTTFTFPSVMIVFLLWKDRKTEGRYTAYNGAVLAVSLLLTALGFHQFIMYIQERDSSSYDDYLEEALLGEILYDAEIPYLP